MIVYRVDAEVRRLEEYDLSWKVESDLYEALANLRILPSCFSLTRSNW